VVAYHADWPQQFAKEVSRIKAETEPWVQAFVHIGSTAVLGLAAKPTIDIMLGVDALQVADQYVVPGIQSLGYDYLQRLEEVIPERRYLQLVNPEGEHLYHLHLVVTGSEFWQRHLIFRDYLRQHPETAEAYAALKLSLAQQFAHNRKAYTEGKAPFIAKVMAAALLEQ